MSPTRVLFVCTGNICRSPTAEGVARTMAARMGLADAFTFDSAGTTGYHSGEAPDPRAVAVARARGYDLSKLRARRFSKRDFDEFDWLLAMDGEHLDIMRELAPDDARSRVRLFLDFHPQQRGDVPDPYYGGKDGFEHGLDLVEQTAERLLIDLHRP